jgi:hypothetical protein
MTGVWLGIPSECRRTVPSASARSLWHLSSEMEPYPTIAAPPDTHQLAERAIPGGKLEKRHTAETHRNLALPPPSSDGGERPGATIAAGNAQ